MSDVKKEEMPSQVKACSIILKILGYYQIIVGALILLLFLIIGITLSSSLSLDPSIREVLPPGILGILIVIIGVVLVFFVVGMGILSVVTANGIDKRKKWARIVGIIIAALKLGSFPVGTAFGVILIIFLLSDDANKWLIK